MDLTILVLQLVIRLGLIPWLLGLLTILTPVSTPAMPHEVKIATATMVDGTTPGRKVVLVDGKPFLPIGVSYHFTYHPDSWDDDLQTMKDLGLNTVRIDLSWRDVDPLLPGHYDFSMLDRFLAKAAQHGLYVVPVLSHTTQDFNTPVWFWLMYRGWQATDENGNPALDDMPSVNHPAYRAMLRDYIEQTVRHIRSQPAILAYQVLNEPRYDQKKLYDYNGYAVDAFHQWLRDRYQSIAKLNQEWSTSYNSFDQIAPLRLTDGGGGPIVLATKQWSDWREFSYDNLAGFTGEMARAVKSADPGHPAIVAEMAWWWWGEQPYTGVSPLHIYKDADIVGYDLYPDSMEDASYFLLTSDMLARYWQKPVWVMELNRKDGRPTGEEIQKFASMALDGGATGIFYFQWQDDWRDGGNYGLVENKGRRKPQFGGLASTVRWLKGQGEALAIDSTSKPDIYLVWPSKAIGEVSGDASPAWELYKTARVFVEGGLRIGLVMEELIHSIDPAKLFTLQNGHLQGSKDSIKPAAIPTPIPKSPRGSQIAD